MSTKTTQNISNLKNKAKTLLSVDQCKLNMKKMGMNNEKIDLIEQNLKAIISKVFDELKNE